MSNKSSADTILLETTIVAAKVNVVMSSGLFDGHTMHGVLGGLMLYILTVANTMNIGPEQTHKLLDAIVHDFDIDAVVAAQKKKDSQKKQDVEAVVKASREAELARAVEAADAEADRIIAAVAAEGPNLPEDPEKKA